MKEENKLFEADYNKELYKIELVVCENGNKISVEQIDKAHQITYQSVVGALEICKMSFIQQQYKANTESFKKQVKPKTK